MNYARQLYKHIPEQVRTSVHQSAGARAFCYGQVLLASPGHQQAILNQIKSEDPDGILALKPLWPFYRKLDTQLRLPLLDMAIPVLKRLPERDRLVFLDRIDRLVMIDNDIAMREWVLAAQLKHHLRPAGKPGVPKTRRFKQVGTELSVLLSALAYHNREPLLAKATYEQVMAPFDVDDKALKPAQQVHFIAVTEALDVLGEVAFFWRRSVIQACVDMVQADGVIYQDEYELVRTIADSFGCPMPPLTEHEWSPTSGTPTGP